VSLHPLRCEEPKYDEPVAIDRVLAAVFVGVVTLLTFMAYLVLEESVVRQDERATVMLCAGQVFPKGCR
jgi:hypothetical protein